MLTNKIFNASALESIASSALSLGSADLLSLVSRSAYCGQQLC